jgi:signal peptidase I
MKIFVRTISVILVIAVLFLGLIYLLPGYDLYVVQSDSMSPTFMTGDVVVTAPPHSFLGGDIRPGAIVTFQQGSEKVTHRILSINGDSVLTKGDANEDPDVHSIAPSQVIGIYLFRIPAFGYAASFLKTRNGWLLGVVLPSILLLGWIVVDIIREALRKESPAIAEVESGSNQIGMNHKDRLGFRINIDQNKNHKILDDPLKELLQEVVKDHKSE